MMTKSYSMSALVVGLAMSIVGSHAVSIPRSASYSKILSRAAEVQAEYDYIIVGGGTAGLTVADRLTESGEYTVLVIELGFFDNSTSVYNIAGGGNSFNNRTHQFQFPSVPQVNLNNRTTTVVGGVMLGGSSGVNGLQVHRPQKEDYNRWGLYFSKCSSWSWEGLTPYWKKAWNISPPLPKLAADFDIHYDESFWGKTSNVHGSFPTFTWPFLKTEMEAFGEIEGVTYPADFAAGEPGAFWYPTSADPVSVTRSFSRTGHYDGIHRDNYETIVGQKVLKVLFNGVTASGVSFVGADATSAVGAQTVNARKEIIISTGTIHTPQLLQRSGVGPRAVLEAAGIPVVIDLPGVGYNFQDHAIGVGGSFTLRNFTVHPDPIDLFSNDTFIAEAQAEWAANKSGPLTIASGNAACFLPLTVIAPDAFEDIATRYEAQNPAAYLPAGAPPTVVAGYAAQKKALAKAIRSPGAAFYNLFLRGANSEGAIVYLHPLSRGTIQVDPTDPFFKEPLVDYRALSNPADIDIAAEFTRFTRRYFQTAALAPYDPAESRPGVNVTTNAELEVATRAGFSPTCFHPIGTAAMLPLELGGVVNEDLLVYGAQGLSVVDASVIPDLPGAYTQGHVFTLAEKAADLIKARA